MSSNNVLHLDFTVSEATFQDDAKKLLQHIRPKWDLDNVGFKVFTDGITNKLMGCYHGGDKENMILVRINGEGTEIIIDREDEQETFRVLSEAGCAPPIYCVFNNGMAYGFFPGVPLNVESVRKPIIQRLVAEEMVQLHSVKGPNGDKTPQSHYKQRVASWIESAPSKFEDPEKQKVFERDIPGKEALRKELSEIVDTLEALKMDIVFSHNDLLMGNIIYNEKQGTVRFIDYEYAFYNYEAFDIGNHFDEYAGTENVNYDLYPSREEQLPWLRSYLESKARKLGDLERLVTDKEVEVLYVQTNKCACAAHFFWGVWALIQAENSTIDFDFVGYASIRLNEHFRRKKEFFSLQLPS